ncbi:MAG: hypothetical protein JO170_10910 [Verrucomicrobia bacterium]|nr:hypothetical protein [Verrucomicrobiota bacterium]
MNPLPSYPEFCERNRRLIKRLGKDYPDNPEVMPVVMDALYRSPFYGESPVIVSYSGKTGQRRVILTPTFNENWEFVGEPADEPGL